MAGDPRVDRGFARDFAHGPLHRGLMERMPALPWSNVVVGRIAVMPQERSRHGGGSALDAAGVDSGLEVPRSMCAASTEGKNDASRHKSQLWMAIFVVSDDAGGVDRGKTDLTIEAGASISKALASILAAMFP